MRLGCKVRAIPCQRERPRLKTFSDSSHGTPDGSARVQQTRLPEVQVDRD
jgi:hypothetical protein